MRWEEKFCKEGRCSGRRQKFIIAAVGGGAGEDIVPCHALTPFLNGMGIEESKLYVSVPTYKRVIISNL